jgi:hypothetical protein
MTMTIQKTIESFRGFSHTPLDEYARWPKISKTKLNNKYIQPHVFSSKLKTITFVHGGRDTHKLNISMKQQYDPRASRLSNVAT